MRLHRIRLRNFRGVLDSEVTFADGVTVIEGPNEAGKSSIAEAFRLIRKSKASSRHREIVALKPVDRDAGPEAEIELSTGPYHLTYRKRWLQRPSTELTVHEPYRQSLTSDEAHERFGEILSETLDVDLLTALDVAQGTSLDQPRLANVIALQRALDDPSAENGGHDALMERIEATYSQYFTPTGRPTGDYRRLAEDLSAAREAAEEYRSRSTALDERIREQAEASARLAATSSQLSQAEAELAEHRRVAARIAALQEAVESALKAADEASRDLGEATAARQARTGLAAEVQQRSAQAGGLASRAEVAQAERDLAERALACSREALEQAESHREAARSASERARLILERHRDHAEHDRLASLLEHAEELSAQQHSARAIMAENRVDDETADRLADLATRLRVAEDARALAASRLTVRPLAAGVHLDKTPLEPGTEAQVTVLADTRVDVPGVVEVLVRPGATPAELDTRVSEAKAALEAGLREAGVGSVQEAHDRAERRAQAASTLERATAELKRSLAKDSLDRLRERLAVLTQRLAGATPGGDEADLAQIERLADETAATVRCRESEVEAARADLERTRTAAEAARTAWVQTSAELVAARTEQARASARLAEARQRHSDGLLDERVAAAERELAARKQKAAEARQALEQADPETAGLLLDNHTQLVERLGATHAALRSEVDGLTAVVNHQAAEGIYDQLAEAEAQLSAAGEAWERIDRSAKAARLLRETMRAKRDEAQRKYVAPFRNRIERLGRVVFGAGFGVEVSDDLDIVSRTLDGRTVPFDSLSAGAREQLALLGRLACAQLVDPAEGAPLILDDTLGFADPARLTALNAVLNDVGQHAQVVLLTCQPQRFAALGRAHVVRLRAGGSG
ncbi:MAG: AAA family ATPase [Propionibacteriaceae bacterium]|nr:AAA family ATPase [Propionibacteriaceae bacterium]